MPRDFLGSDTPQNRAARADQIFEARQQARDEIEAQLDTVNDPTDVPLRNRDDGIRPPQSFFDRVLPREAAQDLDPAFPRQDLTEADVSRDDQGRFRPREDVQRRRAAFEFEERTPLEDVRPQEDIVQQDAGFGLARHRQREIAAQQLDPEFPDVDVGPGDVQPAGDGFGPARSVQRRQAAADLAEQTPLEQIDPFGDLVREGDQFGLTEPREREIAATELDPEFPGVDIGAGDVMREGGAFGLAPSAEREIAAGRLEDTTPLADVDPQQDIERAQGEFRLRDTVIEENRGLFF